MGTRVFVGGLKDPRLRERDLEDFFRGYGRIREVCIKNGYGFVEFEDVRDAEDAVYERNGRSLNGDRVVVEHAMRPGTRRRPRSPMRNRTVPSRSKYRVAIENVAPRASWRDLKALMQRAGEVSFCDVHRHVNGEGHAEFETREGMEKALDELDGRELHGRRIKLREDRSRSRSPRRRRSRSRSRNRSNSRSKSKSPDKQRKGGSGDNNKSRSERSRSRSKSPAKKARKSSKSRSRSKSPAKERSKTRSATPASRNGK